jgi:hypothetical protein
MVTRPLSNLATLSVRNTIKMVLSTS